MRAAPSRTLEAARRRLITPHRAGRMPKYTRTAGKPSGADMTYVVTDNCIRCKYTDCVEVCPVDCFYEGENMLVIHPDECIDCGVCEPECPADAIRPDTESGLEQWIELNQKFAEALAEHHDQARAAAGCRDSSTARRTSWRSTFPRSRARATDRASLAAPPTRGTAGPSLPESSAESAGADVAPSRIGGGTGESAAFVLFMCHQSRVLQEGVSGRR